MKKRLKWLLYLLVLCALAGGAAYGASWLNSRRYFLIVGPGRVDIGRGKMFPVGWDPFQPKDPTTRRAYRGFELPGGIKLARGTTTFTDRVELDQALYRLLTDAANYAIGRDAGRDPQLVAGYIEQLGALPGVSIDQQVELQRLSRRADFSRGRQLVRSAIENLQSAESAFEAAAGSDGPADADEWGAVAERAREVLVAGPQSAPPVPTERELSPDPVPTATTSTGAD